MIPNGDSKYKGNLVIESIVDGKEVTEIEAMKYCYNTEITEVTIQEGIQSIGMEAFLYDIGIKKITLPSTLRYIRYGAFRCCTNLKSIVFNGTRGQWEQIKIDAYNDDILNASIDFVGDKYNYIENEDGTVTLTGYRSGIPSGSVVIPNEYEGKVVSSLKSGFFMNQTKITSITLPNTLKEIGNSSFKGCTKLTSISIPDSVVYIGKDAFTKCTSLVSVITSADSRLEIIDDEAFSLCTSLQSITLPESLKTLGNKVFNGCTVLNYIELPSNLENIGTGFLLDCSIASGIGLSSSNGFFHLYKSCLYRNKDKCLMYCPTVFKGSVKVEDGTEIIDSYAFYRCKNITSIELPSSLTKIGDCAFLGCSSLSSIDFHGVKTVGDRAFEYCTSLKQVTLPSSTEFGSNAFYECYGIQDVIVEDGVKSLSSGLFYRCDNLRYVELPNSLTSIQDSTFRVDSGTIEVEFYFRGAYTQWVKIGQRIHSSIIPIITCEGDWSWTDIEDSSEVEITEFRGDYYPEKVYVPRILRGKTVYSLGERLFYANDKIVEIVLPDVIKSIRTEAFSYCSNLKYINIPESMIDIERRAFFRCTSLLAVEIPSSMPVINEESFSECDKLSSLVFNDGLVEIKSKAFYNCKSISTITIPITVNHIYSSAFGVCPKLSRAYYAGTESQYRDTSVIQIDSDNGMLNTYSYVTYLVIEPKLTESKINNKTVYETSSGSHIYPKVSTDDFIEYVIYFKATSDIDRVSIQALNELPDGLTYQDGSMSVYTLDSSSNKVPITGVSFRNSNNSMSWEFKTDMNSQTYISYIATVNSSASNPIVNRASVKIGDDDWILSNKVQNAF